MDSLVSIIMPVYNTGKFIEESINSVLNQQYEHFELIIVNDGSTDNSEEIALSFQDKRIKYFEQVNKGVSAARNVGLSNMKGDYFCFLDADDVFTKNSLLDRLKIFDESKNLSVVDGSVDFYDMELNQKIKSWVPNFHGNPLDDLLSLSGNSFFGLSWMIKRDRTKSYRFNSDFTHAEDLFFFIQISRNKDIIYSYTEETVLNYRTGNSSAMTNLKGLEAGYFKLYDHLKNYNEINSYRKKRFIRKARFIMIKSYVAQLQFCNALKVLFR